MSGQQQQQSSSEGVAAGAAADADTTITTTTITPLNATSNTSKESIATDSTTPKQPTSIPIPTSLPSISTAKQDAEPEEPELDDFGLPVFKPVAISIHAESSDGEEDDARSFEMGRERRDDDVSSRTTGSPTREVEVDREEVKMHESESSIGERVMETMSFEIPDERVVTATVVERIGAKGVKDIEEEESPVVEPTPLKQIEILVAPPMAAIVKSEEPVKAVEAPVPTKHEPTEAVPQRSTETTAPPTPTPAPSIPQEPPSKPIESDKQKPAEAQKAKDEEPKPAKVKPEPSIDTSPTTVSPTKDDESPKDPTVSVTSPPPTPHHIRNISKTNQDFPSASPLGDSAIDVPTTDTTKTVISSWSHQQASVDPNAIKEESPSRRSSGEWQEMPAYAPYDIYDDEGKLVAKEHHFSEEEDEKPEDDRMGGASKGYTRVQMDEDAQSATSMDDNTKYLWKEGEEEGGEDYTRNPLSQLETTKDLLTEGQKIAYVGLCKLAMMEMRGELEKFVDVKKSWAKKSVSIGREHMKMWSQIVMVRLYKHMDINPDEQIMIEQLSEHGVVASDLTPVLMKNARVKNPMAAEEALKSPLGSTTASPPPEPSSNRASVSSMNMPRKGSTAPPAYEELMNDESVKTPSQLPDSKTLDIDIRWTVLCDLFLVLISDSVYDARSRVLLELVGKHLSISWIDIYKFEKKVTDALEMQENATQNWNESDILDDRARRARNKRFAMMGLATLGGGLVIGLSAGLLAPVIGAGLAAGFTTIGITSTGAFLGGTGGAALITTTAALSGSAIAGKAAGKRTKNVSVFEFRPLYNNKRVNLIVTISGWMNGKEDDVRLPYSTVDPIMGDIYSVSWEPEMMQSMGQTINILATEVLTTSLQQVLGQTLLMALMASLQLPLVLTKLSYLLDNPWNVSLDRAWASGLILADTLIHRNLGVRPITLVGFSLGARVIYSCLLELAKRNAHGLVQNVYMFGSPVVANRDDYMAINTVVRGRFVNGYCTNDWILGYLFRATSGGLGRVAGLAAIENIPGIENLDCTEFVEGHMSYRTAIPKLLKKVGWSVLSEEFSEIEEADPDQLREKQVELISEIEAARKELEKEPSKRKWGLFGKNKDVAKKAEWEVYEGDLGRKEGDRTNGTGSAAGEFARDGESLDERDNVLFDVEAIRRELALQEIDDRDRAKGAATDNTLKPATAARTSVPYDTVDPLNVSKSRPGTAPGKKPASSTGVSTPNSTADGKSPAGTMKGTRTFSFGLFGGRKDSAEKALVGSSAPGSRNSSVMDLSSSATGTANHQINPVMSTPAMGGSSPNLARSSLNLPRNKRGSAGSMEPRSPWAGYSYEDEFEQDGRVQMTFEDSKWEDKYENKTAPPPPPKQPPQQQQQKRAVSYWGQTSTGNNTGSLQVRGTSPGLANSSGASSPRVSYDSRADWGTSSNAVGLGVAGVGAVGSGGGGGALPVLNKGSLGVPQRKSSLGYYTPAYQRSGSEWGNSTRGSTSSAHGLLGGGVAGPTGNKNKPLPTNPWTDDEEEFGQEKEMELSFE
ncbi:hypothetical protein ABW20_dc0101689 [Dactylellina cionopaga]|nr:hypothetical protein ABW20_dc0101689 [Dactylellina cionopaga]